MSDDADIAGDHTDKLEADAIKAISKASERRSLIPTGLCYYCCELVPAHHLYCSSECSVDHRHLLDRKAIEL